jgi:hypothetical protein
VRVGVLLDPPVGPSSGPTRRLLEVGADQLEAEVAQEKVFQGRAGCGEGMMCAGTRRTHDCLLMSAVRPVVRDARSPGGSSEREGVSVADHTVRL